MKLRNQILSYGLVGALSAVLVGSIGLFSTRQQTNALAVVMQSTIAVRSSMDGDMMHDAIRGDVMAALLATEAKDGDGAAEARKNLGEHRKRFDDSMTELQAQSLPPAARQTLEATLPLIKGYGEAAQQLLAQTESDRAAAQALIPEFMKRFEALEHQMEGLGDALEKHAQAASDAGREVARWSQIWIGVALCSGLVVVAFGALALARRMVRPMHAAVDFAERFAGGDLSGAVARQGNDEMLQLFDSLARMQQNFSAMVRSVRGNAESVATASSQISAGNSDLSTRTEHQASSLQKTAAAMEQLSATVRQNADNARQANQLAVGASAVATQGGNVIGDVVRTMQGIDDSSKRIADITGVIDGIAFQTNILALNAAVEAARAGEQGRGFAVVAGEVRALAQRSASAAKEIKELIETSAQRVSDGARLVDRAGVTMHEIVEAIQRVTSIMGEISEASKEQSAGVSEIGTTVTQMDRATQQNAALVEQSAAAAESLKTQASQLVTAITQFKLNPEPTPTDAPEIETEIAA